jgi:hypothetical protein
LVVFRSLVLTAVLVGSLAVWQGAIPLPQFLKSPPPPPPPAPTLFGQFFSSPPPAPAQVDYLERAKGMAREYLRSDEGLCVAAVVILVAVVVIAAKLMA